MDSVTINNNLPDEWKWAKLSEVCAKVEAVKRKEKDPDEELIYLDIGGLDNQTNKIQNHKNYKWKDAPSRAQQIVYENDILFSTVRTYMKNIALVDNNIYHGQIASSGFCVIRGKENLADPKFLFYYAVSEKFLRPLNNLQTGSSYPAVRDSDVFNQPFPLAPLEVQQQIVSKIEELFSEIDKGIEEIKTAQQQLKVYRQAVLKWAFEGKLTNEVVKAGELPEGWVISTLENVLDFVGSGVTPKGGQEVYQNSGVIFIRSQNVYPNKLVLDDAAFISDTIDEKMKRTRVMPDDVLLNITGASIGRCAYVPKQFERANVNQHVCILRTKKTALSSVYLSTYLNSSEAQRDIMGIQGGATRQGLNFQQIRKLTIPLCAIEEQQQIVQEIECRLSVCDKIEETITASLKQAEALRQSILKKAFEGKLLLGL